MQHHNYSLSDLENMLPWEREIYVDMLITYIKEENEKEKRRQQGLARRRRCNRASSNRHRNIWQIKKENQRNYLRKTFRQGQCQAITHRGQL